MDKLSVDIRLLQNYALLAINSVNLCMGAL